jgi:hypothetical protein
MVVVSRCAPQGAGVKDVLEIIDSVERNQVSLPGYIVSGVGIGNSEEEIGGSAMATVVAWGWETVSPW